ncbi:alanine dehydrogenase [bacterium AH-315-C08]|nr:alanine dehydrogenase [bacterium AH-315-C08]
MTLSPRNFSSIALAKEIESPENPGALEKRVALVPADVGRLTQEGIKVYVEYGAGEGVGFSDREYEQSNAIMQTPEEIYRNKEFIIKLKGPSLSSIEEMSEGCTLFCMAHFHSYPDRAKLLQDRCINVVAMEEISESPKVNSDREILGRVAMAESLKPFIEKNTIGDLQVRVIGWNKRLHSAIRRCGNRNPRSLQIIQPTLSFEDLNAVGPEALYFYDSPNFEDRQGILVKLKNNGTHIFDLYEFEKQYGEQVIDAYRASHPPSEFGLRRIQCLHETGQAGARYGVKLLKENKPALNIANAKAVVLGYGNVAQGALHELYSQGIKTIPVLGRSQTSNDRINFWLKDVDLVVNGAEQSPELRGVNFLISNQHLKEFIPNQSVVIDLVGGSTTNRSPVEAVVSCSFLTEPYFVQDDVTVSALWGWPMMGMMRETAIRYSEQIVDVLIGYEKLIDGLHLLKPGVQRALVCGPFHQ